MYKYFFIFIDTKRVKLVNWAEILDTLLLNSDVSSDLWILKENEKNRFSEEY